jgi:endonuclease YncB( thermonuclease family)
MGARAELQAAVATGLLLGAGLAAWLATKTPTARGDEARGILHVVDGDTLAFYRDGHKERIRLWGIDAPEAAQTCTTLMGAAYPCGSAATAYLMRLLEEAVGFTCKHRDTDRYGREVAQCFGDGRDLGAQMVEAGWAIDYTHYSGGYYRQAERFAQHQRAGLWAGSFDIPSEWRETHR